MRENGSAILAIIAAMLAALHPWAASGAAFGCCFFLSLPSATVGAQRVSLGAFSWGLGYAAGVYTYGEGPPWDNRAMLIAACTAALAAVAFTGIYRVMARNEPLPAWLESILDRVPLLKSRKVD